MAAIDDLIQQFKDQYAQENQQQAGNDMQQSPAFNDYIDTVAAGASAPDLNTPATPPAPSQSNLPSWLQDTMKNFETAFDPQGLVPAIMGGLSQSINSASGPHDTTNTQAGQSAPSQYQDQPVITPEIRLMGEDPATKFDPQVVTPDIIEKTSGSDGKLASTLADRYVTGVMSLDFSNPDLSQTQWSKLVDMAATSGKNINPVEADSIKQDYQRYMAPQPEGGGGPLAIVGQGMETLGKVSNWFWHQTGAWLQNTGMENAPKNYNADKLATMTPDQIAALPVTQIDFNSLPDYYKQQAGIRDKYNIAQGPSPISPMLISELYGVSPHGQPDTNPQKDAAYNTAIEMYKSWKDQVQRYADVVKPGQVMGTLLNATFLDKSGLNATPGQAYLNDKGYPDIQTSAQLMAQVNQIERIIGAPLPPDVIRSISDGWGQDTYDKIDTAMRAKGTSMAEFMNPNGLNWNQIEKSLIEQGVGAADRLSIAKELGYDATPSAQTTYTTIMNGVQGATKIPTGQVDSVEVKNPEKLTQYGDIVNTKNPIEIHALNTTISNDNRAVADMVFDRTARQTSQAYKSLGTWDFIGGIMLDPTMVKPLNVIYEPIGKLFGLGLKGAGLLAETGGSALADMADKAIAGSKILGGDVSRAMAGATDVTKEFLGKTAETTVAATGEKKAFQYGADQTMKVAYNLLGKGYVDTISLHPVREAVSRFFQETADSAAGNYANRFLWNAAGMLGPKFDENGAIVNRLTGQATSDFADNELPKIVQAARTGDMRAVEQIVRPAAARGAFNSILETEAQMRAISKSEGAMLEMGRALDILSGGKPIGAEAIASAKAAKSELADIFQQGSYNDLITFFKDREMGKIAQADGGPEMLKASNIFMDAARTLRAGTKQVVDESLGTVGGKVGRAAGAWNQFGNYVTSLWTNAVLTLRPGWNIINMVDNAARILGNGMNPFVSASKLEDQLNSYGFQRADFEPFANQSLAQATELGIRGGVTPAFSSDKAFAGRLDKVKNYLGILFGQVQQADGAKAEKGITNWFKSLLPRVNDLGTAVHADMEASARFKVFGQQLMNVYKPLVDQIDRTLPEEALPKVNDIVRQLAGNMTGEVDAKQLVTEAMNRVGATRAELDGLAHQIALHPTDYQRIIREFELGSTPRSDLYERWLLAYKPDVAVASPVDQWMIDRTKSMMMSLDMKDPASPGKIIDQLNAELDSKYAQARAQAQAAAASAPGNIPVNSISVDEMLRHNIPDTTLPAPIMETRPLDNGLRRRMAGLSAADSVSGGATIVERRATLRDAINTRMQNMWAQDYPEVQNTAWSTRLEQAYKQTQAYAKSNNTADVMRQSFMEAGLRGDVKVEGEPRTIANLVSVYSDKHDNPYVVVTDARGIQERVPLSKVEWSNPRQEGLAKQWQVWEDLKNVNRKGDNFSGLSNWGLTNGTVGSDGKMAGYRKVFANQGITQPDRLLTPPDVARIYLRRLESAITSEGKTIAPMYGDVDAVVRAFKEGTTQSYNKMTPEAAAKYVASGGAIPNPLEGLHRTSAVMSDIGKAIQRGEQLGDTFKYTWGNNTERRLSKGAFSDVRARALDDFHQYALEVASESGHTPVFNPNATMPDNSWLNFKKFNPLTDDYGKLSIPVNASPNTTEVARVLGEVQDTAAQMHSAVEEAARSVETQAAVAREAEQPATQMVKPQGQITSDMQSRLSRMGYKPEEIAAMKPADAQEFIRAADAREANIAPQKAASVTPTTPDRYVAPVLERPSTVEQFAASIKRINPSITDQQVNDLVYLNNLYDQAYLKRPAGSWVNDFAVQQGGTGVRGARGGFSFGPEYSDSIMHLTHASDASTLFHETAHYWRTMLNEPDKNVVAKWAGAPMAKVAGEEGPAKLMWSDEAAQTFGTQSDIYKQAVNAEEKFANGIATYIKTNKAPTSALKDVFSRISDWLKGILSYGKRGEKLAPDVQNVFDRMFNEQAGPLNSEYTPGEISRLSIFQTPEGRQGIAEIAQGKGIGPKTIDKLDTALQSLSNLGQHDNISAQAIDKFTGLVDELKQANTTQSLTAAQAKELGYVYESARDSSNLSGALNLVSQIRGKSVQDIADVFKSASPEDQMKLADYIGTELGARNQAYAMSIRAESAKDMASAKDLAKFAGLTKSAYESMSNTIDSAVSANQEAYKAYIDAFDAAGEAVAENFKDGRAGLDLANGLMFEQGVPWQNPEGIADQAKRITGVSNRILDERVNHVQNFGSLQEMADAISSAGTENANATVRPVKTIINDLFKAIADFTDNPNRNAPNVVEGQRVQGDRTIRSILLQLDQQAGNPNPSIPYEDALNQARTAQQGYLSQWMNNVKDAISRGHLPAQAPVELDPTHVQVARDYLSRIYTQVADAQGKALKSAGDETNRLMMDYSTTYGYDKWLRQGPTLNRFVPDALQGFRPFAFGGMMPFARFPTRSIPMWLDQVSRNPVLLGVYKHYADTANAVRRADNLKESLFPAMPMNIGGQQVEISPFSIISAKAPWAVFFNNYTPEGANTLESAISAGRSAGISFGPGLSWALTLSGAVRPDVLPPSAIFPQSALFLNPSWDFVKDITLHHPVLGTMLGVRNWDEDRQVTAQLLRDGIMDINSITSDSGRQDVANQVYQAVLSKSGPLWEQAQNHYSIDRWTSNNAGFLGGIYPKFAQGLEEYNQTKVDINGAMDLIGKYNNLSNEQLSSLKSQILGTPERDIMSIAKALYAVDQSGISTAAARDAEMKNVIQPEYEYYQKVDEENAKFLKGSYGAVGMSPSGQAWTQHLNVLDQLKQDSRYSDVINNRAPWSANTYNQAGQLVPKSDGEIALHFQQQYLAMLKATEPQFSDYPKFADYQSAVDAWKNNLPQLGQQMWQMMANILTKIPLADKLLPNLDKFPPTLAGVSNANSMAEYTHRYSTLPDALTQVWKDNYYGAYWNALSGLKTYDRVLADRHFADTHPTPDANTLLNWVNQAGYKLGWTIQDVNAYVAQNGMQSIQDRLNTGKTQPQLDAMKLSDMLDQLPPGNMYFAWYDKLPKQVQSQLDAYKANGYQPFDNVAQWKTFFDTVTSEIQKNFGTATDSQLKEFSQASHLNDQMQSQRELQFPGLTKLLAEYGQIYAGDTAARKAFRTENPQIAQYYTWLDAWGKSNPIWQKYYGSASSKAPSTGYSTSASKYFTSNRKSGGGFKSNAKKSSGAYISIFSSTTHRMAPTLGNIRYSKYKEAWFSAQKGRYKF